MFDVSESLRGAFERGDASLRDAENTIARANAGSDAGRGASAALAGAARATLFGEALLGVERARLGAIKAAVK